MEEKEGMYHGRKEWKLWPDKYRAAVSLSFDVDADSFWRLKLKESGKDEDEPVIRSIGKYSINRGLPRILNLLRKHSIKATFFVPGIVAEEYPDSVKQIFADGHEIAHHTYSHRDPSSLSEADQVAEIDLGFQALEKVVGVRPVGYRSPGPLPSATLNALLDHGILYDSSMMGDDIPYLFPVGERKIVEIPWKWSVDDFVFYSFSYDPPLKYKAAPPSDPRMLTEIWKDEFDVLYEEGLFFTIIGHPHQIGQPSRVKALEDFINYVKREDIWITTYSEIAKVFSR